MSTYAIINHKMLQIGDQFDQYQIQAHLAQGGMSDIYRAFDLVNRREVALKIPDRTMIGDPAQYERFQRELEVMNTLDHPAILHGLGSGKYNRIPYLVTEFIDGVSLRELITQKAPLSVQDSIQLIKKIAEGLAYCHKNNVIHRDLKPENILITNEGQPVVMDFGLALTKGAHRVTYSNLSTTMGTPDYMAPEQIEGQRGDQRTDVYALGTIFYELLTGETPFTGDNQTIVMAQHLQGSYRRLDQVNPAVPASIAAIAAMCLTRDPEERYPIMEALVEALENPDNVDLSILTKTNPLNGPSRKIFSGQVFKTIAATAMIIIVMIILAIALQALR